MVPIIAKTVVNWSDEMLGEKRPFSSLAGSGKVTMAVQEKEKLNSKTSTISDFDSHLRFPRHKTSPAAKVMRTNKLDEDALVNADKPATAPLRFPAW